MEKIDPYTASFEQGAEFLGKLFHTSQANYGTVATARSMLSAILPERGGITFGKDQMISRLLKGIFRKRPSLPKHTVVYDTNIVLHYIESLPVNEQLLLEPLTLKLCTLLCILSGQRAQTMASLHLGYMHSEEDSIIFYIPTLLKTTTPKFHQKPIEFLAFPHSERMCVVKCLKEYIKRTELIRENIDVQGKIHNEMLVLSHTYPHKPVNSATLARYVKLFLGEAGVDLKVFTAHSTRSASTSKANNMGHRLKDISNAAGWKGSSTFQKFYKFPIRKNFGLEIMKAAVVTAH